jgi:uncharacterized glyoxalase superfamily protein PhnB
MKLACARIVTGDVRRLARFYEEVTGSSAVGSEEYVEIRTSGASLAICSASAVNQFGPFGAAPGENRSLVLDFEVDDVDREHARLAKTLRDCDWVMSPTTQPWGNRATSFRDPDGNVVNLFAVVRGTRCWRRRFCH